MMSLNIITLLAWIFGSAIALMLAATFFDHASGDNTWDWPKAAAVGFAVGIILAGGAYGTLYMVTAETSIDHVETNGVVSDVELDAGAFDLRLEPDESEWPEEAVLVSEEGEFQFSSDIRPGVRSVELHPDGMGVLRVVGTWGFKVSNDGRVVGSAEATVTADHRVPFVPMPVLGGIMGASGSLGGLLFMVGIRAGVVRGAADVDRQSRV